MDDLVTQKLRTDLDEATKQHMPAMVVTTDYLRATLDRITELETSLAEAEGRVKAITIALHDAIRRPMGQVPESADPFYSPAMAEQAEARRVARSQALSELAALETGEWKK